MQQQEKKDNVGNFLFDPSDPDNKYTMMQFAILYFRRPKGISAGIINNINFNSDSTQRKRKKWTWKEIAEKIKHTNKPINHSLLRLDSNEEDKLAQEAFICIMRYMGDENLKRGQTFTDCIYELLMICHQYYSLRDEIYCQIIRQTTNNKTSKASTSIRGWRLFSILTAYFDCSAVLKPYLFKYLTDMANDSRRAYHGTALICLQNLVKTFKYGGRQFLLSGSEIEAITMGKTLKRQLYHLPGGHRKVINTRSVTVVEEIIQELCQELNIRSAAEQQEFCLCYILESEDKIKMLANDEYVMDVCTELEYNQKQYFLLLKRTVWIHPLRLDNARYIDAMFFQIVPDYIEGLIIAPKNGKISADILDDIARLGAYLYLADMERPARVTSKNVAELIPKTIYPIRTIDQWVERINAKLQAMQQHNINQIDARAYFLEILEKWPYFGTTFFIVHNIVDENDETGECILAINKHGIKIINIQNREEILKIALTEIISTNRYSTKQGVLLDIKIGNQCKNKTLTIYTEQGVEISRLLGQYIYVDSENRAFITGIEQEELRI
ncbi:unnamed protein product [Cercopithifilaria johnstoni]|uniref:Uncharacterized protein n=1 Tax=Cercopithifilaria johnstoni TaxID=2874296 RepID=A0A8J2LYX9_9BILA|nr:unnamed protein product [Cercopithifilaria johnstoni]